MIECSRGVTQKIKKRRCAYSSNINAIPTFLLVPPEIDHAPSDYEVVEGKGAILFCNATGNPQPNITWTKQGNSSILSTSETLNLTKLMREKSRAVYKCTVTNFAGSTEATTKVTVSCEYMLQLYKYLANVYFIFNSKR